MQIIFTKQALTHTIKLSPTSQETLRDFQAVPLSYDQVRRLKTKFGATFTEAESENYKIELSAVDKAYYLQNKVIA